MPLDRRVTTPAAAHVLVAMHQLLWQASTEAARLPDRSGSSGPAG
ncbi:MAG: hypothetical protein Q4P07_14310 [Ornithinimicrobium sp.]|nr:hypothetical protein [Ornithinimicrobium sp.]MDO5741308.1 hypothetical protein [Ornithinimicrobium sp.]